MRDASQFLELSRMTFCAVSSTKEGAAEHPSAGCAFLQSSAFSPASSVEQHSSTICLV